MKRGEATSSVGNKKLLGRTGLRYLTRALTQVFWARWARATLGLPARPAAGQNPKGGLLTPVRGRCGRKAGQAYTGRQPNAGRNPARYSVYYSFSSGAMEGVLAVLPHMREVARCWSDDEVQCGEERRCVCVCMHRTENWR